MTDLPVNEVEFPSDTAHRKKWFRGCSFAHPAKMHLSLQFYLIEHYTKPGDTICDPMAGSGTLLCCCALGRNCILVELEQKFVDMQKANWEKIKSLGAMLGYSMGQATILQGDARQLKDVLADSIIISPPYAESLSIKAGGNMRMTGLNKKTCDLTKEERESAKKLATYSQNDNNIGNLPYKADCAIFSPPYAENTHHSDNPKDQEKFRPNRTGTCAGTAGQSNNNIGNLKSNNYLEAMAQVYQQCHKVLKDGGLMILVVKNFIRNKQIVRLDLDTIKLCENAGFTLIERLARKLTQQSFWRTIYYKKFPNAPKIEYEDVLVLSKR